MKNFYCSIIKRARTRSHIFYSSCNNSAFSTSPRLSEPAKRRIPPKQQPNPTHVSLRQAPKDFDPASAVVYDNFISAAQGEILKKDILKLMRRKRFEKGHWDAVITEYKEIELPQLQSLQQRRALSKESYEVIEEVRSHIEQTHFHKNVDDNHHDNYNVPWLQPHAIYLKEHGALSAHVDSVKFSGFIVAGLSLLSPSIMRLKPASPSEIIPGKDEESQGHRNSNSDSDSDTSNKSLDNFGHVDLYLPPLSLYILSGESRFKYTHELLDSGETFVLYDNKDDEEEIMVHRKDRISIIFRDAKE